MEDFGEIIYLLLLIAFALIGSLSKKKKKKAVVTESPEPPVTLDPWSEFEKKLWGDTEPIEPEPVIITQSPQSVGSPFTTETPDYFSEAVYSSEYNTPEILSYENVDDINKLRVKKQLKESISKKQSRYKNVDSPVFTEPVYNPVKIEFDNPEDARKAFIYSEIFNRKYE